MSFGRILHIDIDAFFAAVEQLRNPRLRNRPVAVGAGVIASCCYEARKYGLHAGMSLRRARRLCPRLEILSGHAALYRCFSSRVFELCQRCSPAMETYLDEAFCDLSGTERLHGSLEDLAANLREEIFSEIGLRVTAGLGPNRMLAKLAAGSAKPDGLRTLQAGEEEAFLLRLPVSRLPGIGPRACEILEKLNIRTVQELRALPRQSLASIFGKTGELFYERCRGRDTRAIHVREIPNSISRETSFHEHTVSRDTIEGMLHYLTERAANTLRSLELRASALEVKLCYSDRAAGSPRSSRRLPEPTNIDSKIFQSAIDLYRTLHTRRVALRRIGVALRGLVNDNGLRQLQFNDLCDQQGLALKSPDSSKPADSYRIESSLLDSLDTIRERYGHSAIIMGRSLHLLGSLPQDDHGFILRTSSLTQ